MFVMWRTVFFLIGGFQLSDAASLICYKGTIDNHQEVALDNAEILIDSSCIDVSIDTFIYTFGYRAEVNNNNTKNIITACLEDSVKRNCVLLNWEEEARSDTILGIEAPVVSFVLRAIPNSIKIGVIMGKTLIKLTKYGLNLKRVILVGHSLGAHLWGNTGREIKSNGKYLRIIVGLDPAGPFYDTEFPEPLNKASASFVYCVHTDPGILGINSSECTIDVWVNFNHFINGDNLQPGCTDDVCNHSRAISLLEYSMLVNKTALEASKATDYNAWAAANGTAAETIYIGDLINKQATPGNYYLTTNAPPDYGKGKDGLQP